MKKAGPFSCHVQHSKGKILLSRFLPELTRVELILYRAVLICFVNIREFYVVCRDLPAAVF